MAVPKVRIRLSGAGSRRCAIQSLISLTSLWVYMTPVDKRCGLFLLGYEKGFDNNRDSCGHFGFGMNLGLGEKAH